MGIFQVNTLVAFFATPATIPVLPTCFISIAGDLRKLTKDD